MIKRIIYFGSPAYLSVHHEQLVINRPDKSEISIPIEDIGVVILDNPQITITHSVLRKLQDNKTGVISCDKRHMPQSLLLPLEGNYTQTEVQMHQLNASQPLKKQLWQQTVIAKIENQKRLLRRLGKPFKKMDVLIRRVQSGDPQNIEGQAAAYYWKALFDDFVRSRFGEEPNALLNYGYSILRSLIARALVSSGLLPTLGIFHKNKYNAFGLADDVMEPFRPFVDQLVYELYSTLSDVELNREIKSKLISVSTMDALYKSKKYPLMVGASRTSKSLADCFAGTKRKLIFPQLPT